MTPKTVTSPGIPASGLNLEVSHTFPNREKQGKNSTKMNTMREPTVHKIWQNIIQTKYIIPVLLTPQSEHENSSPTDNSV